MLPRRQDPIGRLDATLERVVADLPRSDPQIVRALSIAAVTGWDRRAARDWQSYLDANDRPGA